MTALQAKQVDRLRIIDFNDTWQMGGDVRAFATWMYHVRQQLTKAKLNDAISSVDATYDACAAWCKEEASNYIQECVTAGGSSLLSGNATLNIADSRAVFEAIRVRCLPPAMLESVLIDLKLFAERPDYFDPGKEINNLATFRSTIDDTLSSLAILSPHAAVPATYNKYNGTTVMNALVAPPAGDSKKAIVPWSALVAHNAAEHVRIGAPQPDGTFAAASLDSLFARILEVQASENVTADAHSVQAVSFSPEAINAKLQVKLDTLARSVDVLSTKVNAMHRGGFVAQPAPFRPTRKPVPRSSGKGAFPGEDDIRPRRTRNETSVQNMCLHYSLGDCNRSKCRFAHINMPNGEPMQIPTSGQRRGASVNAITQPALSALTVDSNDTVVGFWPSTVPPTEDRAQLDAALASLDDAVESTYAVASATPEVAAQYAAIAANALDFAVSATASPGHSMAVADAICSVANTILHSHDEWQYKSATITTNNMYTHGAQAAEWACGDHPSAWSEPAVGCYDQTMAIINGVDRILETNGDDDSDALSSHSSMPSLLAETESWESFDPLLPGLRVPRWAPTLASADTMDTMDMPAIMQHWPSATEVLSGDDIPPPRQRRHASGDITNGDYSDIADMLRACGISSKRKPLSNTPTTPTTHPVLRSDTDTLAPHHTK